MHITFGHHVKFEIAVMQLSKKFWSVRVFLDYILIMVKTFLWKLGQIEYGKYIFNFCSSVHGGLNLFGQNVPDRLIPD